MKNEYVLDKTSYAKRNNLFFSKKRRIGIVLFSLLLLIGISCILLYVLGYDSDKTTLAAGIAYSVMSVYALFFAWKVRCLRTYKAFIKNYGVSEIVVTTEFTDEEIILSTQKTSQKIEYSRIKEIKEKSDMAILVLKNDTALIIWKNAFIDTTWEECKTFLETKIQ